MQDNIPIIALENLSKTFEIKPVFGARRQVHALRNISLDIPAGRSLALVGESGSGKSTIGRMILRHYPPSSGVIRFRGQDITTIDRRVYGQSVQMVFQDPFAALNPAHRVRHHLMRPLRLHQPDRDPDKALRALLRAVDLDHASTVDKYPHELSGGQRQRVNFARALAVNARLIIADEPTSMLDVSIRKSVLGLMRDLKKEMGLSILYITHDIATAQYLAEDTAVMFGGQIVERGPTGDVVGNPQHPYTRLLRAAIPDPAIRLRPGTDSFARQVEEVRRLAATAVTGMSVVGSGHLVAEH